MANDHLQFYTPWENRKNQLILVVNCGSSSIKLSLFENDRGVVCQRLLDAEFKGINSSQPQLEISSSTGDEIKLLAQPIGISHGLQLIFDHLSSQFAFSFSSLLAVGHRFVHGGQHRSTLRIDRTMIPEFEKLSELAPLHNAACLSGIKACLDKDEAIPQYVIFDTAFYRSMPAVAALYAIPEELATKYPIKRYGFHGISHAFLWSVYNKQIAKKSRYAKVITLHLGNGCSMTAISDGNPMDTSMGFTPAEGLIMATRAGDIDAAILEYLYLQAQLSPTQVMEILNFQSGLLGLSRQSSDMKKLVDLYQENEKAKFAIDMFCYRVIKYLGAYVAVLGGVDAMIFSGGIGENSPFIRERIIQQMEWFGLKVDHDANQKALKLLPGAIHKISSQNSTVALYVIASDENFFIAKEVQRIT